MSFTVHIKPLFQKSIESRYTLFSIFGPLRMYALDATEILKRLDDGTMPCDGP